MQELLRIAFRNTEPPIGAETRIGPQAALDDVFAALAGPAVPTEEQGAGYSGVRQVGSYLRQDFAVGAAEVYGTIPSSFSRAQSSRCFGWSVW